MKLSVSTQEPGCCYPIGRFSRGVCAMVSLDTTFMVQFYCGNGDCRVAGAGKHSAKFDQGCLASPNGGAYLYNADGTNIEPIAGGQPPQLDAVSHATKSAIREPSNTQARRDNDPTGTNCSPSVQAKKHSLTYQIFKRDYTPGEGSWEAAGESSTPPSSQTSLGLPNVGGGNTGTEKQILNSHS